jgi:uncharacterized protein YacL
MWGLPMVLHILRALFVLLMGAVGSFYVSADFLGNYTWLSMAIALCVGVFFVCVDILSPRRKLAIFSGSFFGLIVGVFIAYALSYVVRLLVEQWQPAPQLSAEQIANFYRDRDQLREFISLLLGVVCCYLSISFILQTKDDFRFIIPFVEFSKQTKGARPILLDTSVLIDGRIGDICATGILESQLIVPRFVLIELQQVADSADKMKRNRGRRGLDVLAKLQGSNRVSVVLYDSSAREEDKDAGVDTKLLNLAKDLNARVLTNDFNLNKVAQLHGVDVININDLANALKPVVLPGERMRVRIVKAGEEPGQGVGYLEDGTMVVVEQARAHVDEEVEVTVTSALQTSAGKMIFGRLADTARAAAPATPPSPSPDQHPPASPPPRNGPRHRNEPTTTPNTPAQRR